MRLLVPLSLLLMAGACGGSAPAPAETEPSPQPPDEEEQAEPEPQQVPEGFPVQAGDALEALAAGGRLARCKAPEELQDGAYRTDGGAFVAVHDGWVVMTANAPTGTTSLWKGQEPAFTVRWFDADRERWGTCRPARFHTFEITGKVLDDGGQGVAGATVGACLRGRTTVTDEQGRFTLTGLPDQRCRLYAAVEQEGGVLRAGGPVPVVSQGEDVLMEIVADGLYEGEDRTRWFERLPQGSNVRARAIQSGLDLRRRAIEGLDGEVGTLASGWLDQVVSAWDEAGKAAESAEEGSLAKALGAVGG